MEPQVRLDPLRQMDSGQGGRPLWAPPLTPWDLVGGRDGAAHRVLGLGVGPGCPERAAVNEGCLPGTGSGLAKVFTLELRSLAPSSGLV